MVFKSQSILSRPDKPTSIETKAFCKDSLKFLPMDMLSPTDFIAVPSSALLFLNFSNANLGTLVTT